MLVHHDSKWTVRGAQLLGGAYVQIREEHSRAAVPEKVTKTNNERIDKQIYNLIRGKELQQLRRYLHE